MNSYSRKKQILAALAVLLLLCGIGLYTQVRNVKKTSTLTQEEYYQELNGH